MLAELKDFLAGLKALRKDIRAEKVKQIGKKELRARAEELGTRWFNQILGQLSQPGRMSSDILQKYSDGCGRLIALSAPNNLKNSYLDVLDGVIKPFRSELILPVQTGETNSTSLALLHNILSNLADPEENEYLQEAISCAQRGFFRAAVILGWCAAIDRIHRRISVVGFSTFNVTSAQMASQQKGRFKRFSSPQNVSSIGEIRGVFDTLVIWIIEGMGMIDSNQHTRLRSCFDMRCQCAHPGGAAVTEYNLMSFFSDLNKIVFENPMFST